MKCYLWQGKGLLVFHGSKRIFYQLCLKVEKKCLSSEPRFPSPNDNKRYKHKVRAEAIVQCWSMHGILGSIPAPAERKRKGRERGEKQQTI